jgi:membrane-associated phospholipid phosphatase
VSSRQPFVVRGSFVLVGVLCTQLTASAQSHSAAPPPLPASGGHFLSNFVPSMRELREIPSTESATLLGLGAMAAMLGHGFDASVSGGMSHRSLAPAFASGETLGGARFQMAGAFATYTVGRLTKSPRVAQVGGDLVRAQLVAQGMTAAIKMSARRTRPDGTQFSFPSGHSSVTFASATVLQRNLGWKVGVPAYAAATFVAASRIHERRHFLSDVAFGAAVGIVAGRAVTIGRGEARFAMTPMAAPGGGGVAFTWVGHR